MAMEPRDLTYDERKAAEAAFRGRPFDPAWSPAARSVYDGIVRTLQISDVAPPVPDEGAAPELPRLDTEDAVIADNLPAEALSDSKTGGMSTNMESRDEAVQAGLLIDVTPMAHDLGLKLPVGITKPLWEFGVTASRSLSEDECQARVRDILMALRLHLGTTPVVSPIIQFPVLLSFPPDQVAQMLSLCALVHKDLTSPQSLTLVLPNELSAILPPYNHQY